MRNQKNNQPLSLCEICSAPIPRKPGMPAKTCGTECAAERHRRKERARYHEIKGDAQWKEARAAYIQKLKDRAATDPAFAEKRREQHKRILASYRARLHQNPERLEKYREKQREWFQRLTPQQRESMRERNREWYASLTREEKIMYFYEARRSRALAELAALGATLQEMGEAEDE